MQNSRIFLNSRAMSCSIVMSQKNREGYRCEDDPSVNAVDSSRPVDPQNSEQPPGRRHPEGAQIGCPAKCGSKGVDIFADACQVLG